MVLISVHLLYDPWIGTHQSTSVNFTLEHFCVLPLVGSALGAGRDISTETAIELNVLATFAPSKCWELLQLGFVLFFLRRGRKILVISKLQ